MLAFLKESNSWETSARMGNSINGPITKAKAIKGRSGKATTAMASETGELRAIVIRLKLTVSS